MTRDRSTATEEIKPGRRRLLKTLILGGAVTAVLPEKWIKPVVDTVIVPAHAQGSTSLPPPT